MSRAHNGDVEIEWQSFGDDQPEAVLLVNGLGSQMTRWPEAFCEKLSAQGYRAIRFDNRDTGLSSWPSNAYTLQDMAADGIAVLDAAGVRRAHIAGVSMGGMIVQRMALDHPGRVLSMTSIMSTTGAAEAFRSTPEAAAVLNVPPPDPTADFEAFVAHQMANTRTIGSPAWGAGEKVSEGFGLPPQARARRAARQGGRRLERMGMAQDRSLAGPPFELFSISL